MLGEILLYIGCYTSQQHLKGLHLVGLDGTTGAFRLVESYEVDNPLYLVRNAEGTVLYANEADGLGSFSIGADGRLKHAASIRLGGKAMCHLALMPSGEALTWAAYSSGEAGLVGVRGVAFTGEIRHDRHTGNGPHPRQTSPHCHEAVPTPDGSHYTVVDLGLDQFLTYSAAEPKAPPAVFKTSPAGAGPRHLLFHPDGKHAFAVFEIGNRLAMYAWDEKAGFKELDSCSTLPADWKGLNQDSAIRFTPDGRRVVVSNRGYDSLSVFDFDLKSGKLAFVARSILPGSWPRDFLFIPGTDLAVVTMERSDTLVSARYDEKSGVFTPVNSLHGLYRPVAVVTR